VRGQHAHPAHLQPSRGWREGHGPCPQGSRLRPRGPHRWQREARPAGSGHRGGKAEPCKGRSWRRQKGGGFDSNGVDLAASRKPSKDMAPLGSRTGRSGLSLGTPQAREVPLSFSGVLVFRKRPRQTLPRALASSALCPFPMMGWGGTMLCSRQEKRALSRHH